MTLCGSNCSRLPLSLENRSTLIPAVTADLPGLLRRAACASEIAVIEPPYALDERGVAPFTSTHRELTLRPIHQPRQSRKSVLFGFPISSCSSIKKSVVFHHHHCPHAHAKTNEWQQITTQSALSRRLFPGVPYFFAPHQHTDHIRQHCGISVRSMSALAHARRRRSKPHAKHVRFGPKADIASRHVSPPLRAKNVLTHRSNYSTSSAATSSLSCEIRHRGNAY